MYVANNNHIVYDLIINFFFKFRRCKVYLFVKRKGNIKQIKG